MSYQYGGCPVFTRVRWKGRIPGTIFYTPHRFKPNARLFFLILAILIIIFLSVLFILHPNLIVGQLNSSHKTNNHLKQTERLSPSNLPPTSFPIVAINPITSSLTSTVVSTVENISSTQTSLATISPLPISQAPLSYRMFEDFQDPKRFASDWRLNDNNKMCVVTINAGWAEIACENKTPIHRTATLSPKYSVNRSSGITVWFQLNESDSTIEFQTVWGKLNGEDEQRAITVQAYNGLLYIYENFPELNGKIVQLGLNSFTLEKAHMLKVEQQSNNLAFYLDDKLLRLDRTASFDEKYKIKNIAFDFSLRHLNEQVKAKIGPIHLKP